MSSLDTHASLLAEMRKHCADGSPAGGLIETRLVTTENLIATFRESTEALVGTFPFPPPLRLSTTGLIQRRQREVVRQEELIPDVASHPIPSVPAPKPHVPTEPIVDPSGLFTVDTNPTPVDHLLRHQAAAGDKSKKHAKRKAGDVEARAQGAKAGSGNVIQPKKAKPNHQQPEETVGEDDSFVRGVEARSQAKEDRRKARTEKKRKRQSDGSTNSVTKAPKSKKQKQKHAQKPTGSTEVQATKGKKRAKEEPADTGTQDGQPAKRRKKSKS